MSSPSEPPKTLLLECIQHILDYIQTNNLPTLCALLRVNSTFFALTAPILYSSPFAVIRANAAVWRTEEERTERLIQLLRLFLSEVDPDLTSQLPPWSLSDEDEDEDEDWVQSEDAHKITIDSSASKSVSITASRSTRHYLYHYRKQDHAFLAARAIPILFSVATKREAAAVLSQLDRIFLFHNGPRIQSLCISSLKLNLVHEALPLLGCLRRIEIHHIRQMDETRLEAISDWIKLHDQTFGTLQEIQIGGLTEYDDYDVSDDPSLVQLTQAFRSLTTLDTKSWSQAWAVMDQIPVENLKRLVMDYGEGHPSSYTGEFLLRCRSCTILDLYVPAPDTFHGVAQAFLAQQGGSPSSKTQAVPPIERLYISGDHVNLRNAVEDAAVGLSGTLRILKASSVARHPVQSPSLTWGRPLSIQMPFLQELQLQGDIALELHFSLLRCCPNLKILKLMVNGIGSCEQAENPLEEILSLRKLQILQLLGRWPLNQTLVRGIATHLTGLKMLDVNRCFGIRLDDLMETVREMEYLRRVGWDMEDVENAEESILHWKEKVPKIRIGPIHWDEFYT